MILTGRTRQKCWTTMQTTAPILLNVSQVRVHIGRPSGTNKGRPALNRADISRYIASSIRARLGETKDLLARLKVKPRRWLSWKVWNMLKPRGHCQFFLRPKRTDCNCAWTLAISMKAQCTTCIYSTYRWIHRIVGAATIDAAMDVNSGYLQVESTLQDREKTMFTLHYGVYQFIHRLLDWKNAWVDLSAQCSSSSRRFNDSLLLRTWKTSSYCHRA